MFDIVEKIKSGDIDLFSNILDAYQLEIYVFVYKQIGNVEVSRELTHEIFIKTYENIHKYDASKSSLRTWIYRIATNHMINHHRKRRWFQTELNDVFQSSDDVFSEVDTKDKLAHVYHCINKLPVKQRRIILMHYYSDLSPKEISETLHVPLKTVYSNIRLAIDKLKMMVGETYEL